MWRDLEKSYVEEAWFNSKQKKDFMEKIGIINKDYRAAARAIKYFQLKAEDFGKNLFQEIRTPNRQVIGETFGDIKVISLNEPQSKLYHRTYYNCICKRCGKECVKRIDCLNKKTIDCGCSSSEKIRLGQAKDISGQIFGELKVLGIDKERTFSKKEKIYWRCLCLRCGKETSIISESLKTGNSKTCGCSHEEAVKTLRKDITGQIFGYLKAIEPDEEETARRRNEHGGRLWWKCECLKCGNIVTKNGNELRAGQIISCGCVKESRGELLIENFLRENKISYKKEFSFSDLKGENGLLRFDFSIYYQDNIFALIEFQGEQHYIPKEYFGGQMQLERQKAYDNKKRDYCKNNNIKLIEIPYYKINNINDILSEELDEVMLCHSAMCS